MPREHGESCIVHGVEHGGGHLADAPADGVVVLAVHDGARALEAALLGAAIPRRPVERPAVAGLRHGVAEVLGHERDVVVARLGAGACGVLGGVGGDGADHPEIHRLVERHRLRCGTGADGHFDRRARSHAGTRFAVIAEQRGIQQPRSFRD